MCSAATAVCAFERTESIETQRRRTAGPRAPFESHQGCRLCRRHLQPPASSEIEVPKARTRAPGFGHMREPKAPDLRLGAAVWRGRVCSRNKPFDAILAAAQESLSSKRSPVSNARVAPSGDSIVTSSHCSRVARPAISRVKVHASPPVVSRRRCMVAAYCTGGQKNRTTSARVIRAVAQPGGNA